jgi:hypothetical protein
MEICQRYSTIEKKYITGFFFSMSRNTEKESRYIQYWQLLLFSPKKTKNKTKQKQRKNKTKKQTKKCTQELNHMKIQV